MKPIYLIISSALALLLLGVVFTLRFAAKPPQTDSGPKAPLKDAISLETIRDLLRKSVDHEDCRALVVQLNLYNDGSGEERSQGLSNQELELLKSKDQFGLDQSELAEVSRTTFTPLDAHYLELCILLNEALRSQRLDKLKPLDQAAAAFAWTMRQVQLRERPGDAVASDFVLRRGYGTSLERAHVFLAVLQQLGIDGCMLMVPGKPGEPTIRYWLPGALIDKGIYLFDTRLGLPIPGPKGVGIATLGEVRSQPEVLRQLTVADTSPYDVSQDQAARAEIHIACALSALAPRMRQLQHTLSGTDRFQFGVDPVALLERFAAAMKSEAMKGVPLRVWNAPGDANSPIRLLRNFVPEDEGGTDKTRRRLQWQQQLIPREQFPRRLATLTEEPQRRLYAAFAYPFVTFWTQAKLQRDFLLRWMPALQQPQQSQLREQGMQKQNSLLERDRMPRDLLLRGRFDEATSVLVPMHDELDRQKKLAKSIPDEDIETWISRANAVFGALSEAKRQSKNVNSEELQKAQAEEQQLAGNSAVAVAYVQGASAELMDADVIYLLALCKHEQAERAEARSGRTGAGHTDAVGSWESAASWWVTFLENHGAHPSAASARLHLARARQALGNATEAASILEDLAGKVSGPEKVACLYLARKWKVR